MLPPKAVCGIMYTPVKGEKDRLGSQWSFHVAIAAEDKGKNVPHFYNRAESEVLHLAISQHLFLPAAPSSMTGSKSSILRSPCIAS